MSKWLSALTATLILIAGFAAIALGTSYGKAWTAESARRLEVLKTPLALPNAPLINQFGAAAALHDLGKRIVLLEFIYTRCPSVCLAMGAEFRHWQSALSSSGMSDDVQLLSVSFDPRDGEEELSNYLQRFSGDPTSWTVARFAGADVLSAMLNQLGVIVIPEPTIGFIHNAAIYLINGGKVVGIHDYNDRQGLRAALNRQLVSL